MDTFFISHGSLMLCIEESLTVGHFLKSWKYSIYKSQTPPKSLLIISGHWETSEPTVNVVDINETIYDFDGLPKSIYQLKYPAPGAPELAKRVKELLMSNGFDRVKEDKARGLDHGAWVPLMLMYPEADISVCQLSLQTKHDGTYHYNMGKALAPLREEGVLIIGSGSATHNFRALDWSDDGAVFPWALEFDTWLKESHLNGKHDDVKQWVKKAPHAKKSSPLAGTLVPFACSTWSCRGKCQCRTNSSKLEPRFTFSCFLTVLPQPNDYLFKYI